MPQFINYSKNMTIPLPPWLADWQLDEKTGIPFRKAARTVVLDTNKKLLLFQGHEANNQDRKWWFLPGGGVEPGETLRQAACREISEETGFSPNPNQLIGPIIVRDAIIDFSDIICLQQEYFFLYQWNGNSDQDSFGQTEHRNWTGWEQEILDDFTWWDAQALANFPVVKTANGCYLLSDSSASSVIYPEALPDLWTRWQHGWNGQLLHLVDQVDPRTHARIGTKLMD